MSTFIDLTGQRFCRLVAIRVSEQRGNKNQIKWECKCDCGKKHLVLGGDLRRAHTKSCGCLPKEGSRLSHGMSKTRFYRVWKNIKRRCLDPKDAGYKYYGGRVKLIRGYLEFSGHC